MVMAWMTKSTLSAWRLGMRDDGFSSTNSRASGLSNRPVASSLAKSMSKPVQLPASSLKQNGGVALSVPTITLPRARTWASLPSVWVPVAAAGAWAPPAGTAALVGEADSGFSRLHADRSDPTATTLPARNDLFETRLIADAGSKFFAMRSLTQTLWALMYC